MAFQTVKVSQLSGVPTYYTLSADDFFHATVGTGGAAWTAGAKSLSSVKIKFRELAEWFISDGNTSTLWLSADQPGVLYANLTPVGIGRKPAPASFDSDMLLTVAGGLSAHSLSAGDGARPNVFTGSVGIGTTSPGQELEVNGDILLGAAAPVLYLGNDSDQYITGNAASNFIKLATANEQRVMIDSNGDVGIGADSDSSYKLKVAGNAYVTGNLTVDGTSTLNGGTVNLGDADTDNVVFNADVNSHVLPNTDAAYTLGSATKRWDGVWTRSLTGNKAAIGTSHVAVVTMSVSGTDGLVIPVGTTAQRPAGDTLNTGVIRYNITRSQFEGYNGSQWTGIGKTGDVDCDTEIKAELSPGSDEDTLFFRTGGTDRATLSADAWKPYADNTYDLGTLNLQWKDLYVNGTAYLDGVDVGSASINGGTITDVTITQSADTNTNITCSTLTTTGNSVLGDNSSDTVKVNASVATNLIPDGDNSRDLGSSGTQWKDIYINGKAYIDQLGEALDCNSQSMTNVNIDSGNIDGATIATSDITVGTGKTLDVSGGTLTLAASQVATDRLAVGTFNTGTWSFAGSTISNLGTVTTVDLNGGTIDGATIATSNITVGSGKTLNVSSGTLTLGNGQVLAGKVGAGTFNAGTYSFNGSTISDLGTVTTANIDGGSIDGTVIGANSQSSGKFTTLESTGDTTVGGGEIFLHDSTTHGAVKNARLRVQNYDTSTESEGWAALYAHSTANEVQTLYLGGGDSNTNAATSIVLKTAVDASTRNGTERLTISNTGVVDIPGTATVNILRTTGAGYINNTGFTITAGTIQGSTIRSTGDIVSFYTSDARLKDNISTIENPIDILSKIKGVQFDWNYQQDTYTGKDIGVLAQDVHKAIGLDNVVTTRDNGYMAVKYEKLVPVLIEAVKELSEKVKRLEEDR